MHLNLTFKQMLCLFYAMVFLSTAVHGARKVKNKKVRTCCPGVVPGPIKGDIMKCAYVPAKGGCAEAYVLTLTNGSKHCIDVKSDWVLSILKKEGTPCNPTAK